MRPPPPRRYAKIAATAVVLLVLAGATTQGALGAFTAQISGGSPSLSTGTIDLSISPASALVTFSNMQPGDSQAFAMVVTNAAGSRPLRYAISSTATNADGKGLKDQLVLTVKTMDATTTATPCDNFDGTQLYTGDLDSTAGKLVGSSAQGSQAGDRSLAVSGTETLCFQATLPSTTSTAFTSATTTATFTFDSEQTANN